MPAVLERRREGERAGEKKRSGKGGSNRERGEVEEERGCGKGRKKERGK